MIFPILRRLAALYGVLGLLAIASAQSPAFTLEVEVKNQKGGAVAGAEVSVQPQNRPADSQGARTDDKGVASFQVSSAGDYSLSVIHGAHRSHSATVKLTAAQPARRVQAQLVALPTYGLDLTIVDNVNQPVPGARVEVKGPGEFSEGADDAGRVSFNVNVPGEYLVQIRKDRFDPYSTAVTLENSSSRARHTATLSRPSRVSLGGEIVLAHEAVAPKEAMKLSLVLRAAGNAGKEVEVEQLLELLGPNGAASIIASGSRTLKPDTLDRQEFVVPCDSAGPHSIRARVQGKDGLEWTEVVEFCVCASNFGGFWVESFPGGTGRGDVLGASIVLKQTGNKITGTYERDGKPTLKIEGTVTGKTADWTVFDATGQPRILFYKVIVERENYIRGRARGPTSDSWSADLFRNPKMEQQRNMKR